MLSQFGVDLGNAIGGRGALDLVAGGQVGGERRFGGQHPGGHPLLDRGAQRGGDVGDPAVQHRAIVQQPPDAHHPHREQQAHQTAGDQARDGQTRARGPRTAGSPRARPRTRSLRRGSSSAASPAAATSAADCATSGASSGGGGAGADKPSSVATSPSCVGDALVHLVDDLADARPHIRLEFAEPAPAAHDSTRPPAVRRAPMCSGCVRNRSAAPAPAGSGCAAR